MTTNRLTQPDPRDHLGWTNADAYEAGYNRGHVAGYDTGYRSAMGEVDHYEDRRTAIGERDLHPVTCFVLIGLVVVVVACELL